MVSNFYVARIFVIVILTRNRSIVREVKFDDTIKSFLKEKNERLKKEQIPNILVLKTSRTLQNVLLTHSFKFFNLYDIFLK